MKVTIAMDDWTKKKFLENTMRYKGFRSEREVEEWLDERAKVIDAHRQLFEAFNWELTEQGKCFWKLIAILARGLEKQVEETKMNVKNTYDSWLYKSIGVLKND
jgi:hypothetical protein